MINFELEKFISSGTFLSNIKESDILNLLERSCNGKFGEDVVMYYFHFDGFRVAFIYNVELSNLDCQQVEVYDSQNITDNFLLSICKRHEFSRQHSAEILETYTDGEEDVFFLKNVDVYFNSKILSKITSKNILSRQFIKKFMNRISNFE